MKSKFFKIIMVLLLVVVLAIVGMLTYLKTALPDVGDAPDMKIVATPEMIARGEYLANHVMLCIDCHSTRDWSKFSGPIKSDLRGNGGEIFDQKFGFPGSYVSKNITPHHLGDWTDGEIFRTITTGVNRDNKALFPIMPYMNYGHMDEEDIKAVIAYIRTLPSNPQENKESERDFPLNFIINTIPKKADLQKRPPESDSIAYGGYMANAAGCIECHTKQEKGKRVGQPFAGGFEFNLGNGKMAVSANITPHATGIGNWSKEAFVRRFKQYTDSGYVLADVDMVRGDFQTTMPWTMYAGMKQSDLEAIYRYLRTVVPVDNTVVRFADAKKN